MVLLDVIMPGMSGGQVLHALKDICPDIKHIFMSGHTADIISGKGLIAEGQQFIAKPISLEELAGKVRQVLDGPIGTGRR